MRTLAPLLGALLAALAAAGAGASNAAHEAAIDRAKQAIAVADRDPDDYVKSRGEILRGALGSAPAK